MELDDQQQLRHAVRTMAEIAEQIYSGFAQVGLPKRLCCDLTLELVKLQLSTEAQNQMSGAIEELLKAYFPSDDDE